MKSAKDAGDRNELEKSVVADSPKTIAKFQVVTKRYGKTIPARSSQKKGPKRKLGELLSDRQAVITYGSAPQTDSKTFCSRLELSFSGSRNPVVAPSESSREAPAAYTGRLSVPERLSIPNGKRMSKRLKNPRPPVRYRLPECLLTQIQTMVDADKKKKTKKTPRFGLMAKITPLPETNAMSPAISRDEEIRARPKISKLVPNQKDPSRNRDAPWKITAGLLTKTNKAIQLFLNSNRSEVECRRKRNENETRTAFIASINTVADPRATVTSPKSTDHTPLPGQTLYGTSTGVPDIHNADNWCAQAV